MPLQVIAAEGVFTPAQEQEVYSKLTELLLELNGLSDSEFMRPNIMGEVTILPKGRTYSGGKPRDIAIFELKVPSIVLSTREAQLAWIARATDIIVETSGGKLSKDRVWGNVVYAVDGLWGINGHAYSNAELGAVLGGEAQPF